MDGILLFQKRLVTAALLVFYVEPGDRPALELLPKSAIVFHAPEAQASYRI